MLRILLIDDHAVVRSGIKSILSRSNLDVSVMEAGTASNALTLYREKEWELVLLDIRLPDLSGVELLKTFKREKKQYPVLMLSAYPESQYAVRLIQAGAMGYLSKDADDEEIIAAVELASQKKRYISQEVAEILADKLENNIYQEQDHNRLTDRELEVLLEISSGLGPNEIAKKMNISPKTVSTYRARLFDKMGFKNNSDALTYSIRNNLISID